jgi:apolipoprotein N-acyltransferase
LLQLASLGGGAAVSFVVAGVAAWLEAALSATLDGIGLPRTRSIIAFVAVLLAVYAFGAIRLHQPLHDVAMRVAAVGTPATFGGAPSLPDATARRAILDTLLRDSERAAGAGARLVVWTEAAALIMPGQEEAIAIRRMAEVARRSGIELVAA